MCNVLHLLWDWNSYKCERTEELILTKTTHSSLTVQIKKKYHLVSLKKRLYIGTTILFYNASFRLTIFTHYKKIFAS